MTAAAGAGPCLLGVVVPARNEERRIARCLGALAAAVTVLRDRVQHPPAIRIVVVADSCTDSTGLLAESWPDVEVVTCTAGRVGAARAAGAARVLSLPPARRPSSVWIASTDADSAVPAGWLVTQVVAARAGVQLLLGTVLPDPAEIDDRLAPIWYARHTQVSGHPHVHAANLGVRGDTYRRAGGFAGVGEHEDVLLTTAVMANGGRVVRTADSPVQTSARLTGRTPGGLAGYLRALRADLDRADRESRRPA